MSTTAIKTPFPALADSGQGLTLKRLDLYKALRAAVKFQDGRCTLPILSAVRMNSKGGALHLTVTDLNYAVYASVPANGTDGFTALLDYKPLLEILAALPDEWITLKYEDSYDYLRIDGSGHSMDIVTRNEGDFPATKELMAGWATVVFEGDDLRALLDRTLRYHSREEARSLLCGVLFRFQSVRKDVPRTLDVVATDTHKLSLVCLSLPTEAPADGLQAIIPGKFLQCVYEAMRVLKPKQVKIDANHSLCAVTWDGFRAVADLLEDKVMTGRVVTGKREYPSYLKVIPVSYGVSIVVKRTNLLRELRTLLKCVPAMTERNPNQMILVAEPQQLTLYRGEIKDGSERRYKAVVPDVVARGFDKRWEIKLNASYLLDLTESHRGEWVVIQGNGPLNPIAMRDWDPVTKTEGGTSIAIGMPMQRDPKETLW